MLEFIDMKKQHAVHLLLHPNDPDAALLATVRTAYEAGVRDGKETVLSIRPEAAIVGVRT